MIKKIQILGLYGTLRPLVTSGKKIQGAFPVSSGDRVSFFDHFGVGTFPPRGRVSIFDHKVQILGPWAVVRMLYDAI